MCILGVALASIYLAISNFDYRWRCGGQKEDLETSLKRTDIRCAPRCNLSYGLYENFV